MRNEELCWRLYCFAAERYRTQTVATERKRSPPNANGRPRTQTVAPERKHIDKENK